MRLVIYTNILTPYRKHFYDLVNRCCIEVGNDFLLLVMSETEDNLIWKYEDLKAPYSVLLECRTISRGDMYIHINRKLKKHLKQYRPDIVVCAGSYLCPGLWEVAQLKKKMGFKCLFWSESHLNESRSYGGIKSAVREYVRHQFYRRYDGFWYAGKLSRQLIEKYAAPGAEYYFMPNLIDEEKYRVAAEIAPMEKLKKRRLMGIADEKTVFLCPARLSPVKGILEFMEILDKASNKHRTTVLIAGDGELKERIDVAANDKGLDVRLLGLKNQEEMVELYKIADVFLMPSLSDPNPLSCIEALWAGLPIFISEHCGNYPEVVEQGENGYVFSYKNIENSFKRLDEIINSSEEWRCKASAKSRNIAIHLYEAQKAVISVIKAIG